MPATFALSNAQARVKAARNRRIRTQHKADDALKRALSGAFPGIRVDQNRLDAVTSVLTMLGHDVRAVR